MWVRLSTLLGYVLLIGTAVGIIYPAFLDPSISLTNIFVSLLEPEATQAFAMRWLLVILFSISVYIIAFSIFHKNRPVTVIHSDIKVLIPDDDWARTSINGTYILRANHQDVTSYRSTHTPDFGSIPLNTISADVFCDSYNISSTIELARTDSKGIELLQLFSKPLPSIWYMPLIPSIFIRRNYDDLPSFFRKRLVKRRVSLEYHNEHCVELPAMRFRAPNYPHMTMFIQLQFPATALPLELTARRIRNSAMVEVPVEVQSNIYHVRIDRLSKNEMVRVSWHREKVV